MMMMLLLVVVDVDDDEMLMMCTGRDKKKCCWVWWDSPPHIQYTVHTIYFFYSSIISFKNKRVLYEQRKVIVLHLFVHGPVVFCVC
jgi:hypothetical protein